MLADIKKQYADENFELRVYHEFVAETMLHGLRWARMQRIQGGGVRIFNLRHPHISRAIINREIGNRYERWFIWQKNGGQNDSKRNSRKNG